MEKTNEQQVEVEESLDLPQVEEGAEDTTDWKAEATKLREKAIAQRERTKGLKQQLAEAKAAKESAATKESQPVTSGLDETQLELLDFKGITEADDIKVIESVMKRTGQKLREVLKDDYVMGKLETNKKAREVSNATPSGKKGTGSGSSDSVDYWVQKNAQDGSWPTDYSLKQKVLAAKERAAGTNVPSWQR